MKNKKNNLIQTFLTIILGIFVVLSIGTAKAASTDTLIAKLNSSRAENNLQSLVISEKLNLAAQSKAQDMFKYGYFAHISPSGKTPWDFIKATRYDYDYAGENLAIGYTDDSELHNAWMDSPSHKENILNKNYTQIGMAVVSGKFQGEENTIVVQMFGAPSISASASDPAPQVQSIDNKKIQILGLSDAHFNDNKNIIEEFVANRIFLLVFLAIIVLIGLYLIFKKSFHQKQFKRAL